MYLSTDLAPLAFGWLHWVRFHGSDWLLSTADQTAREYEVNILISVAMAIEQHKATPEQWDTVLLHTRGREGGGAHSQIQTLNTSV